MGQACSLAYDQAGFGLPTEKEEMTIEDGRESNKNERLLILTQSSRIVIVVKWLDRWPPESDETAPDQSPVPKKIF